MLNGGLLNKLEMIHGKRFQSALSMLEEGYGAKDVTIEREPPAVSGVVQGKRGEYVAFIAPGEKFCSCINQAVRKGVCKHLILLCLYCLKNGLISESELKALLIWPWE